TGGGLRQARPGSGSADNPSGPADSPSGPADNPSGHADDSSGPVGWASLNVFNAREAYRFVADISVYVERGWRGKGAGRALLDRLTELGRKHGFHNLVLSVFAGNGEGIAPYVYCSFRTNGTYHARDQLGAKGVDTHVMEK